MLPAGTSATFREELEKVVRSRLVRRDGRTMTHMMGDWPSSDDDDDDDADDYSMESDDSGYARRLSTTLLQAAAV